MPASARPATAPCAGSARRLPQSTTHEDHSQRSLLALPTCSVSRSRAASPRAMTALPPPYPDRRAIIDLIRQECSRPDTVIGGQRHAHHRPLIFHDPPDADGGVSHSPERAAIGAHGDPAVLPRLIAVAARSSRLSAALRLHGRGACAAASDFPVFLAIATELLNAKPTTKWKQPASCPP